jgi:hypothetical protein
LGEHEIEGEAMIKADEETLPGSTWAKTHDHEPVFILCARDRLAPQIVRFWVSVAKLLGVPARKRAGASDLAARMEEWQQRHPDLVKVPD